jgi:hypothetical protein
MEEEDGVQLAALIDGSAAPGEQQVYRFAIRELLPEQDPIKLLEALARARGQGTLAKTLSFTAARRLRARCGECSATIEAPGSECDEALKAAVLGNSALFCRECGTRLSEVDGDPQRRCRFAQAGPGLEDGGRGWKVDPRTGLPGSLTQPWRLQLSAEHALVAGPTACSGMWIVERYYVLVGADPASVVIDMQSEPQHYVGMARRLELRLARLASTDTVGGGWQRVLLPWRGTARFPGSDATAGEGSWRLDLAVMAPAIRVDHAVELVGVRARVTWPTSAEQRFQYGMRYLLNMPKDWVLELFRLDGRTSVRLGDEINGLLPRFELVGVGGTIRQLTLTPDGEAWRIGVGEQTLPPGLWRGCRLVMAKGDARVVVEAFDLRVEAEPEFSVRCDRSDVQIARAPAQDGDGETVVRFDVLSPEGSSVEVSIVVLAAGHVPEDEGSVKTVEVKSGKPETAQFDFALISRRTVHVTLTTMTWSFVCVGESVTDAGNGCSRMAPLVLRQGAAGEPAVMATIDLSNEAFKKRWPEIRVVLQEAGEVIVAGQGRFGEPLPLMWRRAAATGRLELQRQVLAGGDLISGILSVHALVADAAEWQLVVRSAEGDGPLRTLDEGVVYGDRYRRDRAPLRLLDPNFGIERLNLRHRPKMAESWTTRPVGENAADLDVDVNPIPFSDASLAWAVTRAALGPGDLVASPGWDAATESALGLVDGGGVEVDVDQDARGAFGIKWCVAPDVVRQAGISSARILRCDVITDGTSATLANDGATVHYNCCPPSLPEDVEAGADLGMLPGRVEIAHKLTFQLDHAGGHSEQVVQVTLQVRHALRHPVVLWAAGCNPAGCSRLPDLGIDPIALKPLVAVVAKARQGERYHSLENQEYSFAGAEEPGLGGSRNRAWWEDVELPNSARDGEWQWIPVLLGNRHDHAITVSAGGGASWLEARLVALPVPVALEAFHSLQRELAEELRQTHTGVDIPQQRWTTCLLGILAPVRPLGGDSQRPNRGRVRLTWKAMGSLDDPKPAGDLTVIWPRGNVWSERDYAHCLDLGTSTLRALRATVPGRQGGATRNVPFASVLVDGDPSLASSTMWLPEVDVGRFQPTVCAVGDWAVTSSRGPVGLADGWRWDSLLRAVKVSFALRPGNLTTVRARPFSETALRSLARVLEMTGSGERRASEWESCDVSNEHAMRSLVRHALDSCSPGLTELPQRLVVSYPAVYAWNVFLHYRALLLDELQHQVQRRLAAQREQMQRDLELPPEDLGLPVKDWIKRRLPDGSEEAWWAAWKELESDHDRGDRLLARALCDPLDPGIQDNAVDDTLLSAIGVDAQPWSDLYLRYKVHLDMSIDEATAVAIDWFFRRTSGASAPEPADPSAQSTRVCVHDLGGGTYDAALVELRRGKDSHGHFVAVKVEGTTGSLYAGEHVTGVFEHLLLRALTRGAAPPPDRGDPAAGADAVESQAWGDTADDTVAQPAPEPAAGEPGAGADAAQVESFPGPADGANAQPTSDPAAGDPDSAASGPLANGSPAARPPRAKVGVGEDRASGKSGRGVGPLAVSEFYLERRGETQAPDGIFAPNAVRAAAEIIKRAWTRNRGECRGRLSDWLKEEEWNAVRTLLPGVDAASIGIQADAVRDLLEPGYRESLDRTNRLLMLRQWDGKTVQHLMSGQASAEPTWGRMIHERWGTNPLAWGNVRACARGLLASGQHHRSGRGPGTPQVRVEQASWRRCPAEVRVEGLADPVFRPGDDWCDGTKRAIRGFVESTHQLATGRITLVVHHEGDNRRILQRFAVRAPPRCVHGTTEREVEVEVTREHGKGTRVRWRITGSGPYFDAEPEAGPDPGALVWRDAYECMNPTESWCPKRTL